MQRLKRAISFLLGGSRSANHDGRRQLVLGIAGLFAVLILTGASAVIYVVPLGKNTYSAEVDDASSIKAGDQVRVAGVVVGDVKSVELHDDSVTAWFTVERKVFLGAQTTLEVRMLTPVGGHYLTVFPAGTTPLGSTPIPADHVKLPYNLAQAMQDAVRPLAGIDGGTLRKNFSTLASALERQPGSIRALTDSTASLVDMVNRQNQDVQRALGVADEYLDLLARSRHLIGQMLSKIATMETTVLSRRDELRKTLQVVNELLARIAALEPGWRDQLQPLADALIQAWPQWRELADRLSGIGDWLNSVLPRVEALAGQAGDVTIDQSGQSISPSPVCIPVPGGGC